jgi:hypothetical protein
MSLLWPGRNFFVERLKPNGRKRAFVMKEMSGARQLRFLIQHPALDPNTAPSWPSLANVRSVASRSAQISSCWKLFLGLTTLAHRREFCRCFRLRFWHLKAMSANEVMAQIKALPEPEQEKLLRLLAEETDWLENMLDVAVAKARIDESERPVEMLLHEEGLLG